MTKDIVLICDDNYCMPTAVCIQSIIDNISRDFTQLTIHVCSFGLSGENVSKLQSLSTERIIVFVDVFNEAQYKEKINSISQKSHVTPSALIKFELANYFKQIDTLLYLDSDIVAKADLSELLKLDIGESYLAASYEFWRHLIRINYTLKRTVSHEFFFNSGVMLLNLKKMREDDVPEKLWFYKLNRAKTTLMDQESLNAVCSSMAFHLPVKWNFNPYFLKQRFIPELNKVYGTDYKTIEQMEDDAYIIHYVGAADKPWKYESAQLRKYWDNAYMNAGYNKQLDLKIAEIPELSRFESIKIKIKTYGLAGFVCFIINKILKKSTL